MKKSFIAFLLVFALAMTALAVGGGVLLDWQDDIVFTETTEFGQISAAEGLEIQVKMQEQDRLFWESTFTVEETPRAESNFTYLYHRAEQSREQVGNVIMPTDSIGFGIEGSNLELKTHEEGLMIKPVEDVAQRTAAGETRTETLYLKDYYAYYPIRLNLDVSYGYFGGIAKRVEYHTGFVDVSDVFRIPIQDHVKVEVVVTKDLAGGLQSVRSNPASIESSFGVDYDGIVTQNAAYVALTDPGRNGPDYSQIQLGYGLYHMPLVVEDRGSHVGVEGLYNQLANIWPVDYPSAVITGVEKAADDSRIYLTTREQDGCWLTVLSTKDHSLMAQLPIGNMESPGVRLDEELLVLTGYDRPLQQHRIIAYHMETWEKWLDAELPVDQNHQMTYPIAAFDGNRLAVADRKSGFSSIRLLIFEENGLAYMGELVSEVGWIGWPMWYDSYGEYMGFAMTWKLKLHRKP